MLQSGMPQLNQANILRDLLCVTHFALPREMTSALVVLLSTAMNGFELILGKAMAFHFSEHSHGCIKNQHKMQTSKSKTHLATTSQGNSNRNCHLELPLFV